MEGIQTELVENFEKILKDSDFSFSPSIELPFVNREEEIITILTRFVFNFWFLSNTPDQWRNWFTIITDQMYGFGKSTLGKNLLKEAKKYKKEIQENIEKQMDKERVNSQDFKDWYPTILERILGMKHFKSDFKDLCVKQDDRTSERRIIFLLFEKNLAEKIFGGEPIDQKDKKDIFLHIDEVNGEENDIRMIWRIIVSLQKRLCEKGMIFDVYLTGKQTLFNIVRFKL
jgi:hypothetical protein